LASAALAQTANGPEFQVNTYTTSGQYEPSVASDASGNFIVVWTSQGQDGDQTGVYGRRYSGPGVPLGPEFRVNTYTTERQGRPAVAADAAGNFVVVWQSYRDPGPGYSSYGIYAQRYDALGVPVGSEFRVNTYYTSQQRHPKVAADPAGNFTVVWESDFQDGAAIGIFGQRFDAAGVSQGSEFPVNSYTTGFQQFPSIAVAPSGNFLVTWQSSAPTQDGSGVGIFGQCFSAAGVPQGTEFKVNTYTTSDQGYATAAADGNGRFVVVWASSFEDGSESGIFGQRLDANCAGLGAEFAVNVYTTLRQNRPSVVADRAGDFTVAWQSFTQDGAGYGVFGRSFDPAGTPTTGDFQVNAQPIGNQLTPAIAGDPDGDFIVAWGDDGLDPLGGISAQRFGDLIFQDGFDSDSLVHWSSVSTDGTDLKTTATSAMGGTSRGLRARVNDTNSLFVQDDTPSGENRYRARFYFDPNGFDPGETSGHFRTRLFLAQGGGFRLVTIVLKRQGGQYSVEARTRANSGARVDTGFLDITDAPHLLEFDWQRASGPGAADGRLELWLDDVSRATLPGLDNDAFGVDQGRLGALSLKGGASGTLFFDQFESRRLRYIGPE